MEQLSYQDYQDRIDMKDLLEYAGYHFYRKDGFRYPSFVRLDDQGHKIKGDKFIITANKKGCFRPPEQKVYNLISFIKEHPTLFSEYQAGMDKDRLVNAVCKRLLGQPIESEWVKIQGSVKQSKFDLKDYDVVRYDCNDEENRKSFNTFFRQRGIKPWIQKAFGDHFMLISSRNAEEGKKYQKMAFPFRSPGKEDIIGLEVRSLKNREGKSFKGKSAGTDSVNGLWIASPNGTPLDKAENVFWFESAYDAMAYYQIMHDSIIEDKKIVETELREHTIRWPEAKERFQQLDETMHLYKDSVYLSTGGSPSETQFKGVLEKTGQANHFLCFDNDKAGQMYSFNFMMNREGRYFNSYTTDSGKIAFIDRSTPGKSDRFDFDPEKTTLEEFCEKMGIVPGNIYRMAPSEGFKDWNDQLQNVMTEKQEQNEAAEETRQVGLHR